MAAEGNGLSGEHPMYVDLDRVVEELNPSLDTIMASTSTLGKKKAKKVPNPDWPPQPYLHQGRLILMEFYKLRSLQS